MINEEILREIKSLPLEAQKQIEDFVAFLRERYKKAQSKSVPTTDLEAEAFVGMWKEREDMHDASAWVRNLRETHWGK
ncbi:MAG TPA: DUF2281 domain-containing protein [Pyrinomonadaceae bacterium]|nr:DUF2281 domain-containing protein [Pyrinomonadaceae bacterium]